MPCVRPCSLQYLFSFFPRLGFFSGLIARTLIDGVIREVTAVRKDQLVKVEQRESEMRGSEDAAGGGGGGAEGGDAEGGAE